MLGGYLKLGGYLTAEGAEFLRKGRESSPACGSYCLDTNIYSEVSLFWVSLIYPVRLSVQFPRWRGQGVDFVFKPFNKIFNLIKYPIDRC